MSDEKTTPTIGYRRSDGLARTFDLKRGEGLPPDYQDFPPAGTHEHDKDGTNAADLEERRELEALENAEVPKGGEQEKANATAKQDAQTKKGGGR